MKKIDLDINKVSVGQIEGTYKGCPNYINTDAK